MSFRASVCICTRNRPEELRRCLHSLTRSALAVHQVVVSDDSTDNCTQLMLRSDFPDVLHVEGPRRGLGANRNCVLAQATGTHVLFLDDDACLGETFLQEARAVLELETRRRASPGIIVSGVEDNRGTLVFAHDQSFLGHQNVPYPDSASLRTIVINSTLFPRHLFEHVRFDERLVYGYDEVDIAVRAVRARYDIVGCRTAVNLHFPSTVNRDYYRPHVEASRLYVTLRRYSRHERKFLKAGAFALMAPLHLVAHAVRRGGPAAAVEAVRTVGRALRMLGAAPAT